MMPALAGSVTPWTRGGVWVWACVTGPGGPDLVTSTMRLLLIATTTYIHRSTASKSWRPNRIANWVHRQRWVAGLVGPDTRSSVVGSRARSAGPTANRASTP